MIKGRDYLEIWKDITEGNGIYQISNEGRIRNALTSKILSPSKSGEYLHIELRYGINKDYLIHRLVAEAFVPNPYGFRCVNHKDENKRNNNADNLEWCTYQYNARYGKGALVRNSRIIQYDMGGNAIKIWESAKDASEKLGLNYQGISSCCRSQAKSCGNYMWSFADLNSIRKYSLKTLKDGDICHDNNS